MDALFLLKEIQILETVKDLSDFERKLITIIQHYNQEHRSPGISTLTTKTGHDEVDIQQTIRDLVSRKWLVVHDKKIMVQQRLF